MVRQYTAEIHKARNGGQTKTKRLLSFTNIFFNMLLLIYVASWHHMETGEGQWKVEQVVYLVGSGFNYKPLQLFVQTKPLGKQYK